MDPLTAVVWIVGIIVAGCVGIMAVGAYYAKGKPPTTPPPEPGFRVSQTFTGPRPVDRPRGYSPNHPAGKRKDMR